MNSHVLVIYDKDSFYAVKLQDFLCKHKSNPFEVSVFTNKEDLQSVYRDSKDAGPEILLVAESCFDEELSKINPKYIFILNETGLNKHSQYANFNKYQLAEDLFKKLLLEYTNRQKEVIPRFYGDKRAKLIGVYTPVRRCMQTSFAIALSQVLGKKGRTLYINFEQFSGFSKLFQKRYLKDLSDLVYFYLYSKDKFLYWLEGVVERFKDMDYIPPVLTAVSLVSVNTDTWVNMIEDICTGAGYEYVVLDLSDSIQGIFSILGLCYKVYTIQREDTISVAKLRQYEQILEEKQYASIKDRVRNIKLPTFTIKEELWEDVIYGELYQFVVGIAKEDFYE